MKKFWPRLFNLLFGAGAIDRAILTGLLSISIIVNFFLAMELLRARTRAELLIQNRKLTLGEVASSLSARDVKGDAVVLDFTTGPLQTIIYLHSATCYWCDANVENLRAMVRQSSGKYSVVSLSVEPHQSSKAIDLTGSNHLVKELFDPSTESRISFDLSSTPMTVVLGVDGKVLKIWKGAYTNERKTDIEQFLGIQLPGLEGDLAFNSN